MSDKPELKPCPFCGGKNITFVGGTTFKWHNLECDDCGASCGEVRRLRDDTAELVREWNQRADLAKPSEWIDIKTAPKDGTEIVGWFVPNEVDAPEKAKPWITRWEMQQWKDGTGKKVGKPFGMWVTEGWRDPMSFAPTHWQPLPSPPTRETP